MLLLFCVSKNVGVDAHIDPQIKNRMKTIANVVGADSISAHVICLYIGRK